MNDELMGDRILQWFMDIFMLPAIQSRQQAGTLPESFALRAAQVIFHEDDRPPEVRLNEEIRAIADVRLRLPRGVTKARGEPIFASEVDEVSRIRLTPDDDPNADHATFILTGNIWHIDFNFPDNRSVSKRHLDAARQFLDAATFCHKRQHWVAFVDNLFSAAELAAKAMLLSIPDPALRLKSNHKAIHNKYNRFAHLGNVKPTYRKTFNRLYSLRPNARYLKSPVEIPLKEVEALLKTVSSMLGEQERFLKP